MPQVQLKAPCTISKLTLAIALALPALTSSLTSFAADETVNKTNKSQTSPINFKIPAQPLADALNAFISASDWQVGFSAELAKNVRATAVDGSYTPEQALKRIWTPPVLQAFRHVWIGVRLHTYIRPIT